MCEKNVVLWGAGSFGLKFYEKFSCTINKILFWVDEKKSGQ